MYKLNQWSSMFDRHPLCGELLNGISLWNGNSYTGISLNIPLTATGNRLDRCKMRAVMSLWRGLCHRKGECRWLPSCSQCRQAAGFTGSSPCFSEAGYSRERMRTHSRQGLSWELSVANTHSSWGVIAAVLKAWCGWPPNPHTAYAFLFLNPSMTADGSRVGIAVNHA